MGAREEARGCEKPLRALQKKPRGKLPETQRLRKSPFWIGMGVGSLVVGVVVALTLGRGPHTWAGVAPGRGVGVGLWSPGPCCRVPHGLHAHPWALRCRPGGRSYQLQWTRSGRCPTPPGPRWPRAAAAAAVGVARQIRDPAAHPMDWDVRESKATPPSAAGPSPCVPGRLWPRWLGALTPPENGCDQNIPTARSAAG